jgi:peptide-methionine (S)-S-oxide reductase
MRILTTVAVFRTLAPVMMVFIGGCDEFDKAIEMNGSAKNEQAATEREAPAVLGKTAYFAAGCFWGVEAAFRRVEGVTTTAVGYMGGHTVNPTYKQVCGNRTGHAEAVRVAYNPEKVTYEQLLEVFWKIHDPTTLNRQGPDVGSQYRSAIFAEDETQYAAAVESRKALAQSGRFTRPIVTEIRKAGEFYLAEEYHQQYLQKQGKAACTIPLQ